MKNYDIVYVCNSINNKNVRGNELVILEKHPEGLYFKFGENNMNAKIRYYEDLETLNKDFDELVKIKEKMKKEEEKSVKSIARNKANNIEENNEYEDEEEYVEEETKGKKKIF